jgi:hypothetical protein
MTLAEKFHQWLKTEPFSSKERPTLREAQCEQIADEHATEFATWVVRRMLEDPTIELKDDTLGKFKTEKGL